MENEKIVYIKTCFLTNDQNDVSFDPCTEEQITFDTDITAFWFRSDPCDTTDDTKKTSVKDVQTAPPVVTLLAKNKSNTWAKVRYNGNEYYIGVSLFDGTTNNAPGGLG